MKVLILTIPLGNGHNAVAKAIYECMEKDGVKCEIIDVYEFISPALKEALTKLFLFSIKSTAYIKDIASDFYYVNEKRERSIKYSPAQLRNHLIASELSDFIEEFVPDVIICTQVYTAQMINILAENGKIKAKTFGIITDYTVQVYWEDTQNIDYIVTGSRQLDYQLANRKIPKEKILPFGIPISEKFSERLTKEQATEQLGIDSKKKNVLMMGGGMGLGKLSDYVRALDECRQDIQMLVVCGRNKQLFEQISKMKTNHTIKVFGFVDYVQVLMDASDCMITKSGGITISEALSKELPLIIIDQLPGVEDRNVEFLLNNGAAIYVSRTYPLQEAINLIFNTDERCQILKSAMRTLAKPDAVKELCEFILKES